MLKRSIIWMFVACGLLFFFFPKLDIICSQYFYTTDIGFIHKNHPIVVALYRLVPIVTTVFGVFCLIYLCFAAYNKKKIIQQPALYLLLAAILGPGLLVNALLKEHVGRARPSQILEFNGNKAFVGPLHISTECESNCSFSSGHAAMGYYFSSLSYLAPNPYKAIVFLFGIILGSAVGFGRVLQGGHFLSDVIFSGLFIILTNHLCFVLWQKAFKKPGKIKGKKHRRIL